MTTINTQLSIEEIENAIRDLTPAQQAALFSASDKMRGLIVPPFLLDTDTYKLGHPDMYPEDVIEMGAYFTFRGPLLNKDHRIIFYGMRYAYETILSRRITQLDIDQADEWLQTHGPGNTPMSWPKDLWQKVVNDHAGYIPLKVYALREGTVTYPQVPAFLLIASRNNITEDDFQYLVTWFETSLMRLWSECCTATKSAMAVQKLRVLFQETVDDDRQWLIHSRLHDFGSRGVSSRETAMRAGTAHLTSSDGTDTMIAGWLATRFNNGQHIGTSVRATEHSVMTSHNSEVDAVRKAIENTPDGGILSVVADSYNYYTFLSTVLPIVAPLAQAKNILFVIRPDSGDPISCVIDGLNTAARVFGFYLNSKGYKVIKGAAVIQGDGINLETLLKIADAVKDFGYSAENVAYGMGGGLLQKQDRDTLKVAIKLCYIKKTDNKIYGCMKDPTDDITKTSLPGPFTVQLVDGQPLIFPALAAWEDKIVSNNMLKLIWNCGPVNYEWETINQIRKRINREWLMRTPLPIEVGSMSNQMKEKTANTIKEINNRFKNPVNKVEENYAS